MGQTRPNGRVRSVDPTEYNTNWDAAQALVNRKIAAEWLDVEKHVAWHGGYRLDQVVCRQADDGWLLILKAHRNGNCYAAFVTAPTLPEAYELTGEFAARGVLAWQADKWPSNRLRHLLGIK